MAMGRLSGGVAAVVLAAFVAGPFAAGARAEDEKRIAVVNVSQVFKAYLKVKDVQDKMEKLFNPEQEKLKSDERELKVYEDKLKIDPRPQEDPGLFKEMQTFQAQKFDLERRYKKLVTDVEEKRKDEMKGVLNDIKAAIRAIGAKEKFQLILRAPEFDEDFDPNAKTETKPEDQPKSAAELVRKFRENPVMYFANEVDVTAKIIIKLNDDYKNAAPR